MKCPNYNKCSVIKFDTRQSCMCPCPCMASINHLAAQHGGPVYILNRGRCHISCAVKVMDHSRAIKRRTVGKTLRWNNQDIRLSQWIARLFLHYRCLMLWHWPHCSDHGALMSFRQGICFLLPLRWAITPSFQQLLIRSDSKYLPGFH